MEMSELKIEELGKIALIITWYIDDNKTAQRECKENAELKELYRTRIEEATEIKDKVVRIYAKRRLRSMK